jgi:glycosyltransferase involved in cell wall biosynthesis
MSAQVVVDVAGGAEGGAARYRGEFERYLAQRPRDDVRVLGRNRRLTPDWLLRRELSALSAGRKVAFNNAAFVTPGGQRWTVMQNALHYLTEAEADELGPGVSSSIRAQTPVIRRCARRSDVLVAPCTAMAERVSRVLPEVRDRVVVRFNPIAADSFPAAVVREPAILCPTIFQPYKRMDLRLAELVAAIERHGDPDVVLRVTAAPAELPPALAAHPRVVALGRLPWSRLRDEWSRSRAVYFPTGIEAFGFPLAEARLSGHPVIARDVPQSRELAGHALRGYTVGDPDSLHAAVVAALVADVVPDPGPFDPTAYFDFLLGAAGGPAAR